MNSSTEEKQKFGKQKAEIGNENAEPEWWAGVPDGERRLICAVARLLRSAKRSQVREVAWAAAKWERRIGCFIRVRLIDEQRKAEGRMWRGR